MLAVFEEDGEGLIGACLPLRFTPAAEEELGVAGQESGEVPVPGERPGEGGRLRLDPLLGEWLAAMDGADRLGVRSLAV